MADPYARTRLVVSEGVGVTVGLFVGVGVLSLIGLSLVPGGSGDGAGLGMLGFLIGPPLGVLCGWFVGRRKERWVWAFFGTPVGAIFGAFLVLLLVSSLDGTQSRIYKQGPFATAVGHAVFLLGITAGALGTSYLGPYVGKRDNKYMRLVICETVGMLVGLAMSLSFFQALGTILPKSHGSDLLFVILVGPPVGYLLGKACMRLLLKRNEDSIWALAAVPLGVISGSSVFSLVGHTAFHLSPGPNGLLEMLGVLLGGVASFAAVDSFLGKRGQSHENGTAPIVQVVDTENEDQKDNH